jgi:SAM-dependent methyltransferase
MHDDAYLAEEEGRRRSAGRLLDKVGRYADRGRLLDVGCGHGMLLDEASRRGYEAVGLELSRRTAAYAREVLGQRVLEEPLEEHRSEDGYDAIVMADVLEHLDDPVEGIRRCRELLRPGGVLCVVTPDPASRVARLAGPRWWALLPAHTFLLPRHTVRALIAAEGMSVSDDVPFVRTFSARYWLAGLAQRGGGLAAAIDAARRALPAHLSLSLSLRDERVIVAHKARAAEAASLARIRPARSADQSSSAIRGASRLKIHTAKAQIAAKIATGTSRRA